MFVPRSFSESKGFFATFVLLTQRDRRKTRPFVDHRGTSRAEVKAAEDLGWIAMDTGTYTIESSIGGGRGVGQAVLLLDLQCSVHRELVQNRRLIADMT